MANHLAAPGTFQSRVSLEFLDDVRACGGNRGLDRKYCIHDPLRFSSQSSFVWSLYIIDIITISFFVQFLIQVVLLFHRDLCACPTILHLDNVPLKYVDVVDVPHRTPMVVDQFWLISNFLLRIVYDFLMKFYIHNFHIR